MTPEQADLLQEIHDSVVEIKTMCGTCRDRIVLHDKAINGSNSPNATWLRTQLAIVIAALLAFVGLAAKHLFGGGDHGGP
jgi:hypothetical protein